MGMIIMNGKEYTSSPKDAFPPIIYSDEEREVGVWRDGKPLYQKTLRCTFTEDYYDFTIDATTQIKVIEGLVYASSGDYDFIHLGYGNIQDDKVQAYQYSSTTFRVQNSFYATRNVGEFTIYYTKTTDVAGSGKYTTYGGLAQHYSENEQVVGTWIDGKPLYEKTIYVNGNLATGNWTEVNDTIPDVDKIIKITGGCMRSWDNGSHWTFSEWGYTETSSVYFETRYLYWVSKLNYLLYPTNNLFKDAIFIIQYTKTTDV